MASNKETSLKFTGSGSNKATGILYIVATPIGNLSDITFRALEILKSVALIACEDTRVTGKLLTHYEIHTPRMAYHEHNAEESGAELLKHLLQGEDVALVSDSGTPLISDPGQRLVRSCLDAGIKVVPIPGASSVIAALSVSGMPTEKFLFAGFLPHKQGARREALQELAYIPATLVFFESAPRLAASLKDMLDIFGNREAVVARELTKIYEESRRESLATLASYYAEYGQPRGEIVIIVAPPTAVEEVEDGQNLDEALLSASSNTTSLRDAVDAAAAATGLPRKVVYKRAIEILKS